MFKKLFTLLILLVSIISHAQQRFGNEWINSTQSYYKITLNKDGIYRINFNALQQASVPISSINPKNFQLFHFGKEQPIYIAGESDGQFNTGDFIEFFGARNDGRSDSLLFKSGEQANPYYSFVSDTAAYFLTWNSTTPGLRVTEYSNTNYNSFIPEPYFLQHSLFYGTYNSLVNDDGYNYGHPINLSDNIYGSEYSMNEGYTGSWVGLSGLAVGTFPLVTDNYYNKGPKPLFSAWLSGLSNATTSGNSSFNHHVQLWLGSNKLYEDSLVFFYNQLLTNISIDTPFTMGATTPLQLKVINDLYVTADWNTIAYADLVYPRTFELGNATSRKYNLKTNQQYVSWSNYSNGSKQWPVVYDIANNVRVTSTLASTNLKIIFPSTTAEKEIYMADTTEINYVGLKPVTMLNVNAASNYAFLIITHEKFLQQANDYKAYNATRYENFNTLVVTSDQLYDAFYYGLHHPVAVRHFCDYVLENATIAPKYLLLMGKGEQTNLLRNPFNYNLDYVPSIGVPSSDHMFTNGLKGSLLFEPSIATGRIACKTTAEAENYLQKLKDYEALPDTTWWKKNVLHLLGGDDLSQAQYIANVMNTNVNIINNPSYGGKVTSFNKNSTSPIDSSLEQKIQNAINQGAGLFTFFGHGSLNETDIKFGDGCQLNNYKKYPVMYLNGCNMGNCNIAYQSSGAFNKCPTSNPGNIASKGEVFILEKDKGAIVWMSQSNTSSLSTLAAQIDSLYILLARDAYGQSLGNIVKQMIIRTQAYNPGSEEMRNHSLQLVYQGDPALRIFSAAKPDFKITSQDLFLFPYNATAVSDSFAVGINITNYGKAINDSIEIKVRRTYGSNVVDYPLTKTTATFRNDTFYYYIKSKDIRTTGTNNFEVWVDPNDKISELNELNNTASLTVYIPGNGVNLITPVPYAIIDSNKIALIAQSSNLFGKTDAEFYFEIDTTPYFNSPQLQQSALIQASHLAQWKANVSAKDSTVYYWRARLNLPDTAGGYWQQQSFTYVKNSSEGWSQSHYPQYVGIKTTDMVIDTHLRKMDFMQVKRKITVQTTRYAHCGYGIILDGYQAGLNAGVTGGQATNLIVMEFNQFTLDPQLNYFKPAVGYNVSYMQYSTIIPSQVDSFKAYINRIKDGQYVALYTRYGPDIPNWDTSMFSTIEKLGFGVTKTRGIKGYYTSYVAVGQKGGARNGFIPVEDTLHYVAGLPAGCFINPDSLNPILQTTTNLIGSDIQGTLNSELVGPAVSWSTAYRRYNTKEINSTDTVLMDVMGVSADKTSETLLFSVMGNDSIAINSINAKTYPYLRLVAHLRDTKYHTAPGFLGWQVRYVGIAEGTLDPTNTKYPLVFSKDTMVEGDTMKVKFAFVNISRHPFKSPLHINYTVSDINQGFKQTVQSIKDSIISQLNAGDTMYIQKSFSTQGMNGSNILDVFVNPQEQPEASYANNSFNKFFFIRNDHIKPILDVTFDGVHIRNKDIVAPNPLILITAKDENKTLLLNDTSKFILLLYRPGASKADTISLSSPEVTFIPATNTAVNKAVVEYLPKNLVDGVYTLKVQAYDRSGNISGTNGYLISFEVINKQTATRFYPYPNPFSTSMHFVFTITGKVPDDIYIQITTVTGKVVKTVTKDELGFIRIGTNITEWAWDGTDTYGDKLANGVYLYRVFLKENGQDVELNTDIGLLKNEKFFIKDIGKIYLLR